MQEKYREQVLQALRREVQVYSDCTESDKPVYHDLFRLSEKYPGFTGYPNATPIPEWSEKKRLWYWALLKASVRRRLRDFEKGRRRRVTRRKGLKLRRHPVANVNAVLEQLQKAGDVGLTAAELHERLYGGPPEGDRDLLRVRALIHLLRKKGALVRLVQRYAFVGRADGFPLCK